MRIAPDLCFEPGGACWPDPVLQIAAGFGVIDRPIGEVWPPAIWTRSGLLSRESAADVGHDFWIRPTERKQRVLGGSASRRGT